MSIGSTLEMQPILLFAGIVGLVALALAYWVLTAVLEIIGRLLGIHISFPGIVLLLAVLGVLLAGSLELDRVGTVLPAQIIDKRESIVVQAEGDWITEGDWTAHRTLTVRYSPDGTPLPGFTSTSAALVDAMNPGSTVELATLSPSVPDFDRLHPGGSLDVRILRVGTFLSLVRPADQTSWTLVPWGIVADALLVAALVCLAWWLRKTPVGYVPIAVVVVIAVFVPLVHAYQTWQQMDDLSGATVHAAATVGRVSRVTTVQIGDEGEGGRELDLLQPYDIVQLAFVPPNYPDPIVAVDEVDANVGQSPRFTPGSQVEVVYPPGNPRGARVPGQTRTHYLKTTLMVYENFAFVILFLVVLAIGSGVISSIWRARMSRHRISAAMTQSPDPWDTGGGPP